MHTSEIFQRKTQKSTREPAQRGCGTELNMLKAEVGDTGGTGSESSPSASHSHTLRPLTQDNLINNNCRYTLVYTPNDIIGAEKLKRL